MNLPSSILLALAALASPPTTTVSAAATGEDWPGWRGPTGDGVAASVEAPVEWDAETNVKWKVPLANPANGSPVVTGERIFLTTPVDPEGKQRALECYARADGSLLWKRTIDFGRVMPTHRTNPYGGSTPATNGEVVVVWHSSAGLYCYDLDGQELWRRDLGEFRHQWGYGTSPVLHEGRVFLNTGPGETSFVIALDLATGETLWETVEPDYRTEEQLKEKRIAGSWCTPVVVDQGRKDLLVCGQPTRVVAYDMDSGSIAWTCDGVAGKRGDLTYSSPVVADDSCFFFGGWEGPNLGVRIGGEGDVTKSHRRWRHEKQMSNCGSGAFVNGRVFVPDMGGILWCIDPATGLPDWKKRVGRGATWGSIVVVGELMYLLTQDGTTVVFTATKDGLDIVAENAIPEQTNSTLAVVDGEVYLRTHQNLYCIAED